MLVLELEKNSMPVNDLEELKERVEAFVKQQSQLDATQAVKVVCDEGDLYYILYGADIQVGVAGFGETADGAYNDFVDNWERYRSISKTKK